MPSKLATAKPAAKPAPAAAALKAANGPRPGAKPAPAAAKPKPAAAAAAPPSGQPAKPGSAGAAAASGSRPASAKSVSAAPGGSLSVAERARLAEEKHAARRAAALARAGKA